ncbi:replication initiation protein [Tenacibaculum finnmarkense genomovar finnmarkense]|uniref:replication initiation protein n=1 Tax=Tenacibaculum finnmarkense TaxID=2781243 RepID=UPI001E5E8757|nr:replication initiation protein [Tenacibaculum finnmarkense]MCD8418754.1 replication initiation protein [Tenacibaculum finnmarkense genomovar finnmarkense]MCG8187055.1 replication initiation protein [Tenacibaculum finnmarkense genomovar finnmarkense]MCG8203602.1 replication initiation protein [Tenacibaculum finnmarkense genomovar finnmarkense]MCG8211089.1 replication initiation protein [Tenacibaculum finnmarkense genomovar finnmarkense]MCG8213846.1 replication initiation protein [Tenacibacul
MRTEKYTIQSNQVTLSQIKHSNIYEKRLLNAFIDSLAPLLKGKIEEAKNNNTSLHTHSHIKSGSQYNQSIIYTYNLSDIEPNPQNYNRLRAAIKKLRRTDIDIITPDGAEIYTGFIESAVLIPLSETFEVQLSLTAYQFLCDISKGYSLKSFKTTISLKSLYSSNIYELLCKWRNKTQFQIDIEELRFITNSEKKYSATKDFKKRVLDAAKKELDASEFTDLSFSYEDVKVGRSIRSFKIFIKHTNKDNLEKNKLIKQASPRHDFNKEIIDFLNRNDINFNDVNRKLFLEFFELNGVNNGLDELEIMKDSAMRNSRNSPQSYIIGAVKKNIIDALEKKEQAKHNNSQQDSQTNIIAQLAELTKRKTV